MKNQDWTPGSLEWHAQREQSMKEKIETVLQRLESCDGYHEGGDVWVGPAIGQIRDAMAGIERIAGHHIESLLDIITADNPIRLES